MAADLTRIIGEAARTSHFIILRGAGSDFCVGRASMGEPPQAGSLDALDRRRSSEVIFNCYGAVDFARNLHATINSSAEMRKAK